MNRKNLFAGLLIILISCECALGASLWRDRNLYATGDALKTGDLLVVRIDDVSRMRFTMTMQSKAMSDISVNPDVNITGFLPKVAADSQSNQSDSTQMATKGDMLFDVAVRVTARAADGTYTVQGTKEYSVNGVASRFTVSGSVDPALVEGRIVRSGNVADFRLSINTTQTGIGLAITRPPLKEGEVPSKELTADEKQKIMIDYLTKMLAELSR